jgi:hypothetical protein
MGTVTVRCPATGREIPTGIVADRKSFRATPVFFARAHCPFCRIEHDGLPRKPGWARLNRADALPWSMPTHEPVGSR